MFHLVKSPSCKDDNKVHREVFVSLNNCKIETLTASMFSDDLMGRGTPALRRVVLPVCLNVVTHVTIDFRSGTLGATLIQFRKVRWVAITDSRFEK